MISRNEGGGDDVATYPGTTIETLCIQKNSSKILFEGIFAAGGITMSQVSNITGLEVHVIQNWVKRKFLSSPVKKLYSREQLARILIINMLRESLQLESICSLIDVIAGEPDDKTDDLIGDAELYHRYVNMTAEDDIGIFSKDDIQRRAELAAEDFEEKSAGDRKKLIKILLVMYYAHESSRLKDTAREILSSVF